MRTLIQLIAALAAVALSSCDSPRRSPRVCEVTDGCAYRSVVENGPKPRRVALAYAKEWAGPNAPCVAIHVVNRRRAEATAYRVASRGPLPLE